MSVARHVLTLRLVAANQVLDVLGVEAARSKISAEILYIMDAYGIHIDCRHLMLLSDVMTFKVRARDMFG